MLIPKFVVGEVCLLRSEMFPEMNGEVTIVGLLPREGYMAYALDIPPPEPYEGWHENCLRKKHEPGQCGFHTLMGRLTNKPALVPLCLPASVEER